MVETPRQGLRNVTPLLPREVQSWKTGRARPRRLRQSSKRNLRRMPATAGLATNLYRDRSRARLGYRAQAWPAPRLPHLRARLLLNLGHRRPKPLALHRRPGVGHRLLVTFEEGEFMVHDRENIGDTELLFTTVEFLDSPNAPLEPHSRTRSAVGVYSYGSPQHKLMPSRALAGQWRKPRQCP